MSDAFDNFSLHFQFSNFSCQRSHPARASALFPLSSSRQASVRFTPARRGHLIWPRGTGLSQKMRLRWRLCSPRRIL